jgi:hypothetical protein
MISIFQLWMMMDESPFDEFLHHFVGVNSLFGLGLELLDELVGLLLAPFVPHRHQHLLQEIALEISRLFIFLLVLTHDAESLRQLLLNVVLSHLLQHHQVDI